MRNIFGGLALIFVAACNNNSPAPKEESPKDTVTVVPKNDTAASYIHHFADTTLENRITTALMKLSFVRKANTYIDSFSNHRHGIAFMLDSLGKGENDIYVQAGYNGDQRFETYYQFYVNTKTLEIKVYEVVDDKKQSVKE